MAAVSAPHAPSALTPPSSSHGGQNSWNYSAPTQMETTKQSKTNDYSSSRPPLTSQTNGNSLSHKSSRSDISQKRTDPYNSTRPADSGYLAPARLNALNRKDSSISETGSAPDSLLDLYGPNRSGINSVDFGERKASNGDSFRDDEDPEHSRWIHRDKLARIESQELQAAGIILPRTRAASKSSRREHSRDQQGSGFRSEQAGQRRLPVGSLPAEEETGDNMGWDLRLPEEAAEDRGDIYRDMSGGVKGVSRIPVCRTSPLPIPIEHLERDTPLRRKQGAGSAVEEEGVSYPKPNGESDSIRVLDDSAPRAAPSKRTASESSPPKKTPATRKGTVPANRTASAPQGTKSKSAPNRDASGQRPSTKTGDQGTGYSVKRPEGDPPWLASMFKPDPRLPPDQQLLPTVAKRLQQEQWEKEGKFGNAYDTSFRPLNDEEFHQQPETATQAIEMEETKPEDRGSEWPLRSPRSPKSPTSSTGRPGTGSAGAYTTMPKISSTQQGPIPSATAPPTRLQEPAEETKSRGGCGCCVVM